jgi:hypothetical protein
MELILRSPIHLYFVFPRVGYIEHIEEGVSLSASECVQVGVSYLIVCSSHVRVTV